jgi:broad specificity phosphatase PhoE
VRQSDRKGVFSEMSGEDRRVFLIRHGETEFNRLGIFRGRFEVELNERGRRQAHEIGEALKQEGIEFLLHGPLGRAAETASIISEVLGVSRRVDEAFNNILLGKWQGVPKKEVQRDYPREWEIWTTEPEKLLIPGGETVEQVRQRAFTGLMRVLGDTEGSFGIVTHRSVIKTLAASMLDMASPYFWKLYIDNAAYSVFGHGPSGFSLISWNSNTHLSEKVDEVF